MMPSYLQPVELLVPVRERALVLVEEERKAVHLQAVLVLAPALVLAGAGFAEGIEREEAPDMAVENRTRHNGAVGRRTRRNCVAHQHPRSWGRVSYAPPLARLHSLSKPRESTALALAPAPAHAPSPVGVLRPLSGLGTRV